MLTARLGTPSEGGPALFASFALLDSSRGPFRAGSQLLQNGVVVKRTSFSFKFTLMPETLFVSNN